MNIHSVKDPKKEAGEVLGSILGGYTDKPVLLLLSGGSALSILDHVSEETLRGDITITTLDERYSKDTQTNNFLQIASTDFYTRAQKNNARFLETVPQDQETLGEFAVRLNNSTEKWITDHPEGHVVATMGFGEDGHTAGIFPMDEERFNKTYTDTYVVPVVLGEGENEYTKRASVTPWFIRTYVHDAVVLALGKQKYELLQGLQTPKPLSDRPMSLLSDIARTEVFSDCTTQN